VQPRYVRGRHTPKRRYGNNPHPDVARVCGFSCQSRLSSRAGILRPTPKLLLYSENRVLCRLGDSEFDDSLGWNLDLLLRLGIEAGACLPLLFHQLAKAGQNEFAVLFDLFVGQRAECIEKRSSRLLVCLSGLGECDLKFCFGHLLSVMAAAANDFKEARVAERRSPASR
jgi:hypothetical protein